MDKFDYNIFNIDQVICDNIDKKDVLGEGLLSQNILSKLRNFVEAIALKLYSISHNTDSTYEEIKKAIKFIASKDDMLFLNRFYKCLQVSVSHYTIDQEGSARLMWKYFDYLSKIRVYIKKELNLDVLHNLDDFPLESNEELKEYYQKIAAKVDRIRIIDSEGGYTDRYYIHKIKPFYINNNKYFELTLSLANDSTSKFSRIIAFTQLDIPHFYAVHLTLINSKISILNRTMSIKIINNFMVSIRPCEFDNFFKILGYTTNIKTSHLEYKELMRYLSLTGITLSEVLEFDDKHFNSIRDRILETAKVGPIFDGLIRCRSLSSKRGYHIIKYLLYRLNNKVIKAQTDIKPCEMLSNLHLRYQCIPFDDMPYAFALREHNAYLSDLFQCISPQNREHELLARFVKNNTEKNAKLFTKIEELTGFDNVSGLIERYNALLYYKHKNTSSLCQQGNFIYINGYENNTLIIIQKLIDLASSGIKEYKNSVEDWLGKDICPVDCDEKKSVLKEMFVNSHVALIYGSAGTGKSTLINHISQFFVEKNKIYLANTHSAVENLKRKIVGDKRNFMTIKRFLISSITECDILFIDECSTVNNQDMVDVVNRIKFKLLVLVGDIYQIESIKFGNWFSIARSYVPSNAVCELAVPYRSKEVALLKMWESVRNLDGKISEHLAKNSYSSTLDESIFVKSEEDEIVLCLNYDGLYGINNINNFLQDNNSNTSIEWGIENYKVGDPVIFNETKRFDQLLYNNLKGNIIDIKLFDDKIQFYIEIELVLNEMDIGDYDIELIGKSSSGKSIVSFFVNKYKSSDDDDEINDNNIVPFQIAYAISIHKAQGLEYDSVKIVFTDEIEELISHNIFYTAVTRAKKKLKIYWSPETEQKIFNEMKLKYNKEDACILAKKYELKIIK